MNIDKSLKQEDERLFKQRLQRVHAITGIIFSLFMYIALFLEYLLFYCHLYKIGKSPQDIIKCQILQK